MFRANSNWVVKGISDSKVDETVNNLSLFQKSKNKSKIHMLNIRVMSEPEFLTINAKKAFN